MIKVGNDVSKEFSENLETLIVAILKAGYEYRTDKDVLLKALDTISSVTEVKNVSISNSTFTNEAND